jgi:Co/Zn/Cd efflux system component
MLKMLHKLCAYGIQNLQSPQQQKQQQQCIKKQNFLIALVKLVVGMTTGSVAMIADAGHSLADIASDFITLSTLQLSALPKDEDHPSGHARLEPLG